MKKIIITSGLIFTLSASVVFAQGMMGGYYPPWTAPVDSSVQVETAKDEAAGQAVWDKLLAKRVTCQALKEADFDVLGDYFMGQMMGGFHAAMDQTMATRLGDAGEMQMHIALGKRLSGCDTSAVYPAGFQGFSPMMGSGGDGALSRMGKFFLLGGGKRRGSRG